jgi:hypothetical protein
VPAGERQGIVDHDDQFHFAAGVLQAVLGVATLDEQPTSAGGSRQRGVLEADHHPALWETVAIQEEVRPHPQHHARMCVFGLQLRPLPTPVLEGQHDLRQLSTRFGRLIG